MAKISDLDYIAAKKLFTVQTADGKTESRRPESAIENNLFYSGDHLQKSKNYRGYIGERPAAGEGYGEFMNRVEAAYVSSNKVKETVDRHDNGVLGRVPLWRFVYPGVDKKKLTDEQLRIMSEADAAMTAYWDEKDVLSLFQAADVMALLEGKCAVRPFVLAKSLDATGNLIYQTELADPLKLLRFETVTADKAGVFEDEETFESFGLYCYENGETKEKGGEKTFVGQDGNTYLETFGEGDVSQFQTMFLQANGQSYISNDEPGISNIYSLGNLGGHLWMYEFEREALISEQVRALQKCLNLDLTMMMRNINLAGFRQKTYTNADQPTEIVTVTDGAGITTEVEKEIPLRAGLLSTPFLNGLPIYSVDSRGQKIVSGYTNPNINIADPVAVDTFIESLRTFYEAILTETYQLHVAISGDATASGKSRQEARAEFEKSLMKTKTALDALGRWMLEVALRFAANLCRRPEFLELRCDFNSIVDAGTPDAAERDQNIKEWQANAISFETLLSRNGIEDTDNEMVKIQNDENYQLNIIQKRADVINSAQAILTIDERVRIMFPNKTDAEVTEYITRLGEEDPVIAAAMEARANRQAAAGIGV